MEKGYTSESPRASKSAPSGLGRSDIDYPNSRGRIGRILSIFCAIHLSIKQKVGDVIIDRQQQRNAQPQRGRDQQRRRPGGARPNQNPNQR